MSDTQPTRRDFLKTAGSSIAAATLATSLTKSTAAAEGDKPFGYAVVGIGALTKSDILPAFANMKHARLTGLVSGDVNKARETAAKYGVPESGLYSYDTFDRIAENPAIDAVYIVLPNNLHAEYTVRAFKAGKHVLVEKPMAISSRECETMIAAGKEANKLLSVAYRLRYEPYTQEMIRMVREKVLGSPRVIVTEAGFNIGNPDQWRLSKTAAGGGSMMDIGIYALNAARYLSGENPTEVTAFESTNHDDKRFHDVEDTVTFQLKFPSGVLASCVSSYGTGLNRFRVHAEKGSFELEPGLSRRGLKMNVFEKGKTVPREFPEVDHFGSMMDDLAVCAATGKTPITDGVDGLNDLLAIEAIYESMKNGRAVKIEYAG
ncbi:Gfo/Idh/MocA family protein [Planctomicrobium sp. SH664]|uniref:Gfo/Idh/MocA family protein n=1 Tax=Planctomicrobium sp. SH664 TaxID=3448125 RepID=UPI003F5BCB1A